MRARNLEALELTSEAREAGVTGRGRRVRKANGLTQQDIATALRVRRSTIGMYELNLRQPRGKIALEYGRLLRQLETRAQVRGGSAEHQPAAR